MLMEVITYLFEKDPKYGLFLMAMQNKLPVVSYLRQPRSIKISHLY